MKWAQCRTTEPESNRPGTWNLNHKLLSDTM